ncbi:MAG: outer membrane lipid asymmetry maintenance protein MlaD [Candidatus Muproteobacteria bacterium RBG_16_64_11]|uniref:Outer membrane lipid asymmetry maintenance protein MlaD n=1 Tax=Candidatus Muproteobacteria bacterium RBG_16_64_11 TaxID=1817758 RepID=A0A1F6TAN2_9PROT|nr:MAG: outer membrane lipid asymmetry maintenance protein MlaD [Candidatus Muproteobacteria bacterium RBG_16_64_11]
MVGKKTLEIWVGIFVAAGIAALAMLAFRVGNLTAADVVDGYKVRAYFENIGGLKVKSPVTMAGVRVGRVSEIYFDNESYRAVVVMNIDGRYRKIPKDPGASINTSGLLGEQYVGLDPGGDLEYLRDGDKIMLAQSAIVLEKLVSQFLFSQAEKPPQPKK